MYAPCMRHHSAVATAQPKAFGKQGGLVDLAALTRQPRQRTQAYVGMTRDLDATLVRPAPTLLQPPLELVALGHKRRVGRLQAGRAQTSRL